MRVLGEVLEVAPSGHRAVQAQAGALEDLLAEIVRLLDEGGSHADGHEQRRCGRGGGAVAHADADGPVGDAEAGDTQLLDLRHVPFDPNLGGQLLHRVLVVGVYVVRETVDVDRLHAPWSWAIFCSSVMRDTSSSACSRGVFVVPSLCRWGRPWLFVAERFLQVNGSA